MIHSAYIHKDYSLTNEVRNVRTPGMAAWFSAAAVIHTVVMLGVMAGIGCSP